MITKEGILVVIVCVMYQGAMSRLRSWNVFLIRSGNEQLQLQFNEAGNVLLTSVICDMLKPKS